MQILLFGKITLESVWTRIVDLHYWGGGFNCSTLIRLVASIDTKGGEQNSKGGSMESNSMLISQGYNYKCPLCTFFSSSSEVTSRTNISHHP
jgi:hypothetical protein